MVLWGSQAAINSFAMDYHDRSSAYEKSWKISGEKNAGAAEPESFKERWRKSVKEYDAALKRLLHPDAPASPPRDRPRTKCNQPASPENDRALKNLDKPLYLNRWPKPCPSCRKGDYPRDMAAVIVLPDNSPGKTAAAWRMFKDFEKAHHDEADFKAYLWTSSFRRALASLGKKDAKKIVSNVGDTPIVLTPRPPVLENLDRRRLPAVIFLFRGKPTKVAYWPLDLEREWRGVAR